MLGTAIIGGMAVIGLKPKDQSGARSSYFVRMQTALKDAGIASPTLIIDLDRLNANIDTLVSDLPAGMGYRIVTKSLPSLKLIEHIAKRAKTERLMTFNQAMLSDIARLMPSHDQLLGKPLPVQAARAYYASEETSVSTNIQWLIDTPARLAQYSDLAKSLGVTMNINLEIDVGFHRGGFSPNSELQDVLQSLKADPNLIFTGFMGYEPHVPKIPDIMGWRDRVLANAWDIYQNCLDMADVVFDANVMDNITRNAAGSPTYKYYQDTAIANEISAGSVLVKPTDFDTDLLRSHQAATFIATPVLKTFDQTRLPALEGLSGIRRAWNPNYDNSIYIHGGHWLAKPEDPPGLTSNPIIGHSSNQELFNGGPDTNIAVDDFVFLRPTQSEAVFMQFGDLVIYQNGKIIDYWPVFPASA